MLFDSDHSPKWRFKYDIFFSSSKLSILFFGKREKLLAINDFNKIRESKGRLRDFFLINKNRIFKVVQAVL